MTVSLNIGEPSHREPSPLSTWEGGKVWCGDFRSPHTNLPVQGSQGRYGKVMGRYGKVMRGVKV